MSLNTFKTRRTNRFAALPGARVLSCSLMVTALVMGSAAESRADTKYPLVCRGGGGISLDLNHNGGGSIGANSINNNLIMSFKKAPWASFFGLQPGECAWADRAVAPSEPGLLCISSVSVEIVMRSNQDGAYFQAFTFTNNNSPSNVPATNALQGLLTKSQYQTFWVSNDRQGCFRP